MLENTKDAMTDAAGELDLFLACVEKSGREESPRVT
jgi:hypothetical protein